MYWISLATSMSFERRRLTVLFTLKRWPRFYSLLRGTKDIFVRCLYAPLIEALRRAFAIFSDFGPVTGWFSARDQVVRNAIEGRIVLDDQGIARVNPPSVMEISKLRQNEEQPWPIFWSRLKNVRLCGVGLAPVNGEKQVCIEAVYG